MTNTVAKLKRVLARIKSKPQWAEQLADDADIANDLELDSIEMLQFMLEVESSLELTIDFEKLDYSHLGSIERFARFLEAPIAVESPTTLVPPPG